MTSMTGITVAPATLKTFDDVERALTGGGDGASCQCQWWMVTGARFDALGRTGREEMLVDELEQSTPPGLVGYVDGAPAGWVRVGPRPMQERLLRTRIVKTGATPPLDDPEVWAITCFSVRKEHRSAGVAQALLGAAVDFARDQGASLVEGYPQDTSSGNPPVNDRYVGTVAMFERAGFRMISHPTPKRAVMALSLGKAR